MKTVSQFLNFVKENISNHTYYTYRLPKSLRIKRDQVTQIKQEAAKCAERARVLSRNNL